MTAVVAFAALIWKTFLSQILGKYGDKNTWYLPQPPSFTLGKAVVSVVTEEIILWL